MSTNGNPYIVAANLTVPSGTNLTLEPGVIFWIGSGLSITANGMIQAVGAPTQHITIQAPVTSEFWNAINVNGTAGTNLFVYCDFTNANTALVPGNNSINQVSFCTFQNVTNGIYMGVYGNSWTQTDQIFNCVFSNCFSQAIYGQAYGEYGYYYAQNAVLDLVVENCVFSSLSNGCVIYLDGHYNGGNNPGPAYGYSYPSLIGNVFQNLTGTAFLMQDGTHPGGGNAVFQNNTLVNCWAGVNATDPWNVTNQANIYVSVTNAVTDSGSGTLSQQVSYNAFYNNKTNFIGYNLSVYGEVIIANRNGTPSDLLYNIYTNPLFANGSSFFLATNSPCVNAAPPGQAFENTCFPPSIGTAYGDLGAYGGPTACSWNLAALSPVLIVAITNLTNGAFFSVPATIAIDASVSDANASALVTNVTFLNGTNQLGVVTNAPFNFFWSNTPLGTFVLTAVAGDNHGLSASSLPVSVTVSGQQLAVGLTTPTNGAAFPVGSNIPLTAIASDPNPNGVITQLSIFAGTNVLGVSAASPLSVTWTNPPYGPYVLTAVAADNYGIVTTSAPVNITVTVQKPVVAIINPTNGAAFAGGNNISVNAAASDANSGGGIVRVSFYAGTNLLGVVSNAPYGMVWTNPATGTYSLTAVATDNYGASNTSGTNTVIVNPASYIFTFNSATYSVNENGATVALTVVNHADLTGYVSYQTVDGSAHGSYGAGGDYTASQGNLYFAGQNSLPINIPIVDNFLDGSNLQFQVVLFSPTVGSIGSPGSATVTIMRNDPGATSNAVLAQVFPTNRPAMTGQLTVWLPSVGPAPAPPFLDGMQWRFPWESAWRDSGSTAISLVAGDYPIEFRSPPGYLAIPFASDPLVTNGLTTVVTNSYYAAPLLESAALGSLTASSIPANLSGAGWQFIGETAWRASGSTAANLLPDTYLVAFEPVSGYATPSSLAVVVTNGMSVSVAGNYPPAQTLPSGVDLPQSQSTTTILNYASGPYGFSGQLQTDVGYGSGAAVTANVVLTAAHMVFNDNTLSYVSNAWWSFQEQAGTFQPEPQAARGWYVLSGYAAQRTNDLTVGGYQPDQSSPQSRDLDVAALYFLADSGRTGFCGFISSDAVPNPYLTGSALKTLVGYPVDGSMFNQAVSPGQLYATPLDHQAFYQTNDQVYAASWLFSYPGNSGGPLCVLYTNGNYYPAAVYLGTLFNSGVPYASVVRALDSNVFNLITTASELGDTGTNNSGGGVITIIPSRGVSASHPGYLILQLGPPSAVQAGAAWDLAGQSASYYSTVNPSLQEVTTTNALVVQFKPIAGWNLPTNRSVTVVPGVILTNVAMYTVTNPLLTLNLVNGLGLTGTTNTTYQIQSNSSLTGGAWIAFRTNTLISPGFNLITNKPVPGFYRALWLTN
ncbi:MAG: Ig-like domain-containing protein [Verrucomicrobiota bacterium]